MTSGVPQGLDEGMNTEQHSCQSIHTMLTQHRSIRVPEIC